MLEKMMESVSKIRLTGGLVGRVCTVMIVLFLAIAALGIASRNEWIMGGAILILVVFALPMLWRIIAFAESNPNTAILDGAEFVRAERQRQASKGTAVIPVVIENKTEPRPMLAPPGRPDTDAGDVVAESGENDRG